MVLRRSLYREAQRKESKSGEHSSSATKGATKASAEPSTHKPSESADEWTKFCHSDDKAATTSQKAKTPGKKDGGGSTGQGGPKETKSSASSMNKSCSAKESKRTGKEAGLSERQRWLHSYKVPKLPAPYTSVSSEAQALRKSDKRKRPRKKAAKKGSSSTPGKRSILR